MNAPTYSHPHAWSCAWILFRRVELLKATGGKILGPFQRSLSNSLCGVGRNVGHGSSSFSCLWVNWVLGSLVTTFPYGKFLCPWDKQSRVFFWDLGDGWCWEEGPGGSLASIFNPTSWSQVWVPPLPGDLLSHKLFSFSPTQPPSPRLSEHEGRRARAGSLISYHVWSGFAGSSMGTLSSVQNPSTIVGPSRWPQCPLRFCSFKKCTGLQITGNSANGALNSLGLLIYF